MSDEGLRPVSDDLEFAPTIQGFAPGQKLFGRYTLVRVIGRGGMGLVWLAQDEALAEEVALKFLPETVRLDAAATEELKRETRRSRKLSHPNIVKVYDFVSDPTAAAISMEFIDGDTLSGLRARQPDLCFQVSELQGCVQQLLNALIYAHEEARVVHRDLKPANIMLSRQGKVKVTDFGISSSISDNASRVTMVRGTSGTMAYMSPQQAMGKAPSVQDDIYALGATLFELLTGKPPFFRGDILTQVWDAVPPTLAERRAEFEIVGEDIPAYWEETIAACLAKEAEQRPQSMTEVAARLGLGPAVFAPSPAVVAPEIEEEVPMPHVVARTPESYVIKEEKPYAMIIGIIIAVLAMGGLGYYFGVVAPAKRAAETRVVNQPMTPPPSASPTQTEPMTVAPDSPEVIALRVKALAGDIDAQRHLGDDYLNGATVLQDYNRALFWYQKAADQGDAPSQDGVGLLYINGWGVPKDYDQALKWFQKAYTQGDLDAPYCLGLLYQNGWSVPQDYGKAMTFFQISATHGRSPQYSQYKIGEMYENGQGVPKDMDQALNWYKIAATRELPDAKAALKRLSVAEVAPTPAPPPEAAPAAEPVVAIAGTDNLDTLNTKAMAGDADAAEALANIYHTGQGVSQDNAESLKWDQKAAELGNVKAQKELGYYYKMGQYVPQDYSKALSWYQKAADQGDPESEVSLARMYSAGQGTASDPGKAIAWLQKAADQGSVEGQGELGKKYLNGLGVVKDYAQALIWFHKAADQGGKASGDALCLIGDMYLNGWGVAKDDRQAFAWYQKSADQGDADGQWGLGTMYMNGWATEKDYAKALSLFQKSAESSVGSQVGLGLLYLNGWGVTQDYAQAFTWFQKATPVNNNSGAEAQYYLGLLYENGEGTVKDMEKARHWYQQSATHGYVDGRAAFLRLGGSVGDLPNVTPTSGSANQTGSTTPTDSADMAGLTAKAAMGDIAAMRDLGLAYLHGTGVTKDEVAGRKSLQQAADKDDAIAQDAVAFLWQNGIGGKKDVPTAFTWYQKAAAQGMANSEFKVGEAFYNGTGVSQDYAQALEWLTKAADANSREAQFDLGVMYERGEGVLRNTDSARAWYKKADANGYPPAKDALVMLGN